MTYQDPHPSVPAHADATAPQRLEPTMLSPSKLRHFMMRQENTESEGTLAATSGEFHWMTYRPERSTVGDSYNSFLDELGFTSKDASKRSAFVDQFKDYVDSSTFRYVRQHENEVQFKNMVLDFLRVFGLKYWGPNDRHHLQERDPAKGFLCPRDANRSSSRLVEVLESMFDYKAKGIQNNDAQKPEEKRVVPHLNLSAMTWPPNDKAVTAQQSEKRRQIAIKHSDNEDSDEPSSSVTRRTSSSGFNYTVLKRSWKPTSTAVWSQRAFPDEDNTPSAASRKPIRSSAQGITYTEDSDLDTLLAESAENGKASEVQRPKLTMRRIEKKSRASPGTHTDARPRKKARNPITRPMSPERLGLSRSPNTMGPQAPTPRSSRPSVSVDNEDSDADIKILDSAPPTFNRKHSIKEEKVAIKQEPLPMEITHAIRLVVSASNQPDMAPVMIPLGSVTSIEKLYDKLATACELRSNVAKKVTAVSATYTWSGEKQRLRKGQSDDWELFKSIIEKAWERDTDRFDDACKVLMLLHVDE